MTPIQQERETGERKTDTHTRQQIYVLLLRIFLARSLELVPRVPLVLALEIECA